MFNRSALTPLAILGFLSLLLSSAPMSMAHTSIAGSQTGFVKIRPPRVKLFNFKSGHNRFGHFPFPNQPTPPPPVTSIFPESYGAKRDGSTNDLPAIQQAITAAAGTANSQVVFSTGTYVCAGQILDNGVSLVGSVNSNVLFTNSSNGGVKMTGAHPSIAGLTINFANPAANSGVGLLINGASNFTVNGIVINACPADNLDCFYSGPGSISNTLVTSSGASSLLIKDCTNVTVSGNRMPNIGVISGGAISTGLIISNNVFTTTNGSSMGYVPKIAGLFNSSFTGNTILCGSLYIGPSIKPPSNGNFDDGSVYNVYVAGNTLDGSAVAPSLTDFNGIMVNYYGNAGGRSIILTIANNYVQNLAGTLAGISLFPGTSNINVTGNVINTIGRHIGSTDYPSSGILCDSVGNINIQGNSISNTAGPAIHATAYSGTGSLNIDSNSITAACTRPELNITDEPVIQVDPLPLSGNGNPQGIGITNNVFHGPTGVATYFIEDLLPSSVAPRIITGNTQTATALGNNIAP